MAAKWHEGKGQLRGYLVGLIYPQMLYGVSAFTLFHSGKLLCVWAEGEFQFLRGERV